MNIVRVNIACFTGCKRIKQRRISFVLGYLRTILWKNSTAISIQHRILATLNIKKSILTACMPLKKQGILVDCGLTPSQQYFGYTHDKELPMTNMFIRICCKISRKVSNTWHFLNTRHHLRPNTCVFNALSTISGRPYLYSDKKIKIKTALVFIVCTGLYCRKEYGSFIYSKHHFLTDIILPWYVLKLKILRNNVRVYMFFL
jgi:hypothetical protein